MIALSLIFTVCLAIARTDRYHRGERGIIRVHLRREICSYTSTGGAAGLVIPGVTERMSPRRVGDNKTSRTWTICRTGVTPTRSRIACHGVRLSSVP